MLEVKLPDLEYCRMIQGLKSNAPSADLISKFNYIFLVSYLNTELKKDFEFTSKTSAIISFRNRKIEEIFSSFHATCRNEIRRTFKEANLTIIDKIEDWQEFYEFHKICERERNWIPVPLEELKSSKIIAVKYENKYIAGMSCYMDFPYMRIGRIFSRRKSNELTDLPGVMFSAPARRIVYEFCKWGIDNKYTQFDLGGVDVDDASKAGITKFKRYFGTELVPVQIGRYKDDNFDSVAKKYLAKDIDIT